jgi:hypothetical protein
MSGAWLGGRLPSRIRATAERIAPRFALIVKPGTTLVIAPAPLILLPLGQHYVRERSTILRRPVPDTVSAQ